ncbi:hypothetical protein AB0I55_02250 [Actinocatenispora sera]|uniref:hypothetical protein n=1 Tax=Actinocatenispora sera TaxID=390989 RepID=UPI0033E8A36B
MPFDFGLSRPATLAPSNVVAEPLEDRHDYEYLAMRACAVLADVGYTFHIGGFGRDDWRFDVSYDVSTLVEQLPDLLDGLVTHGLGEVDFYSQGVERSITFERSAEAYVLRCHSRTSFTPSPDVEHVGSTRLAELFTRLTTEIAAGLRAAGSEIAGLHPFDTWHRRRWTLS